MDPANCIVVQDVKSVAQQHDQRLAHIGADGSTQLPTEDSLLTASTAGQQDPNNPYITTAHQQLHLPTQLQFHDQQSDHQGPLHSTSQLANPQKYPQIVELREFNEVYHATIPPYQFWNSEFRNKHPAFIRFNFTLPWGANFAVYGRRNVAPSVTKYDFAEFVRGGRIDNRLRRRRRRDTADDGDDSVESGVVGGGDGEFDILATNDLDQISESDNDGDVESNEDYWQNIKSFWPGSKDNGPASDGLGATDEEKHIMAKRSSDMDNPKIDIDTMMVNVSLLQYLDTGKWFLSVYNDELLAHTVTLIVTEAEGVSTTCPSDCSGRGSCYLGKCDCIDGYQGADCSKSKFDCAHQFPRGRVGDGFGLSPHAPISFNKPPPKHNRYNLTTKSKYLH